MFQAGPTPEALSAAIVSIPNAVPPPFLAELSSSVNCQEILMLKLQSDKLDCLRTLSSDMKLLLDDLPGQTRQGTVQDTTRALVMWKRDADYEGCIREESEQFCKMEKLVADSRRLRVEMLRTQTEQRTEHTQILKEMDQLREDARRAVGECRGAEAKVETLRRQLSEETKLHEETRSTSDRQTSELDDKEKELRKVALEVVELRAQLSEEKKLHEEARLARDQLSEYNYKLEEQCEELHQGGGELLKEIYEGRVVHKDMKSEIKKLHEEARLERDKFSEHINREEELCEELRKDNKAFLDQISKEREVREEMKSEIERIHEEARLARDKFSEHNNKQKELYEELQKDNKALVEKISEMKSEIEGLRVELLEEREHVREQIMAEMRLEQVEQERSRRALLERQVRAVRISMQTTARD